MLTMTLKLRLFIFFLMSSPFFCQGQELLKVEVDEDNILLLDARVKKHHAGSSIDAYISNDRILIAIEPLFDGLKLKYKIIGNQLKVWKDDDEIIINLSSTSFKTNNSKIPITQPLGLWADDGYYKFIELAFVAEIFGVRIETDLTTQIVSIFTGSDTAYFQKKIKRIEDAEGYLFPIQRLAILNEQRIGERFNSAIATQDKDKPKITISDQYRLFTPPHGRVVLSADLDDKRFNGSAQLVSDLLYHSTNLTMSQSDGSDFAASISFNRYKESPDDLIFGLFDYYSLGDVSGVSNNLTTSASAGVGMVLNRSPENFRRKNLETTIDELAPPNWDAELFHNGRFIGRTKVPGDGRLLYDNVEIYYGLNIFEIKLYGPYGEEEIINKTVTVKQNPLAKGQVAYSVNALDRNHNVINDKNNYNSFEITNYGGSIDYGVTERWQIGASFASIDNEQQLFSLKNNLSFNNFLLENSLSFEQGGGYAQLTTLTGSILEGDNYSFRFESADDFKSEVVNSQQRDFSQYTASYALPTDWIYTNFSADYYIDDITESRSLTNTLSKNISGLSLTHRLTYSQLENILPDAPDSSKDSLNGTLGLSGSYDRFNLSGQINYDPQADDIILRSSSITLRTRLQDPYKNNHYVEARYFPLNEKNYLWQLRHNVAWQSEDYQLTFSSGYNANDEWDIQFGIQFFLGYDYHHNKFIMDKVLSAGSATLDVHSYLDRQANGEPDVLDYNLPNVRFSGNSRWVDLQSGEDGRTILPGVSANGAFSFGAKWQEGSATLNNDYVVYTHPGAYVDVNMPFFLFTDVAGFVVRQQNGEEIGLRNATMQLLSNEGDVVKTVETDEDGYFEFLQLMPDSYKVVISPEYLAQKGLTGEITGTSIATGGKGGFVELPVFILRRMNNDLDHDAQDLSAFVINEDNVDALVWSKDEKVNQNYFTLPPKGKVKAKHSLTEPKLPTQDEITNFEADTVEKNSKNVELVIPEQTELKKAKSEKYKTEKTLVTDTAEVFTISSVLEKIESSETVLPRLKLKQLKPSEVNSLNSDITPSLETAKSNKDKVMGDTLTGWVIQFAANESSINEGVAAEKYSAIGQLFLAQKQSSQNKRLNCIISHSFVSKKEAMTARDSVGLKGWITTANAFSNIKKIY